MKKRLYGLSGLLILMALETGMSAEPTLEKFAWTDLQSLGVEGKGWTETANFYDRLPAAAQGRVPEAVWNLSHNSAGLCARFVSAAPQLAVRWTLRSGSHMQHMADTGISGVDLYGRTPDGGWQYLGTGFPAGLGKTPPVCEKLFSIGGGKSREYLLYLPLYNGVVKVEVGVPEGGQIEPAPARSVEKQKPIVFYGTSITQGGCASRPGTAWTAIVGRRLDWPLVNLGFSGSGKMEIELAEFLTQLDPAVYVICCLENVPYDLMDERAEPFIRKLREARPQTPILLCEEAQFRGAGPTAKSQKLRAVYEKLSPQDPNLHYLEGRNFLGADQEATVDGTHPTDLGMMRMAEVYAPALTALLKGKTK